MRIEVLNAIKKEISTSYDNEDGIYTLFPDTFDLCYEHLIFTTDEKNFILNRCEKIIDFVNEKRINLDSELQKMKIEEFFNKYDLNSFI